MEDAAAETIIVTGASSGIGRELAIQLAASGKEIWLIGRDVSRLEEVGEIVRRKGACAHIASLDLTDTAAASRFLDENFPKGGKVDQVYLAAAITFFGEVKEAQPGDWERIYRTNLLSPVQWALHFYRNMVTAKHGKIIIISSLAAYSGYPTATAYATMKGGLLGLFRSMVHEGRTHNVSFHLASPGYVNTGIYRSAIFRGTTYERTMSQIESLGFPVLPAERAAGLILHSVRRGVNQFALPGYASVMKWIAPRMPFFIGLIHRRIINRFRQAS